MQICHVSLEFLASQVRREASDVAVALLVIMEMESFAEQYAGIHVAKTWNVWLPILADVNLVTLDVVVRLPSANRIAKTMGNVSSQMSVNVPQDSVVLSVRKHIVIHLVNMEGPACLETFALARMVLWDHGVKQWFATGTVKMVVNVLLQMSASAKLAGMDLPAVQLCATLYASMVDPVVNQIFAFAQMDSLGPTVRTPSATPPVRMVATA